MKLLKHSCAMMLVAACVYSSTSYAAEVRTLPSHGEYVSMPPVGGLRTPSWAPADSELGDTDSGNANNPALPSYAQGRGQETGGPARELIPN